MSYKLGELNKEELKLFMKEERETSDSISILKRRISWLESKGKNLIIEQDIKSIRKMIKEKERHLYFLQEEIQHSRKS